MVMPFYLHPHAVEQRIDPDPAEHGSETYERQSDKGGIILSFHLLHESDSQSFDLEGTGAVYRVFLADIIPYFGLGQSAESDGKRDAFTELQIIRSIDDR